MRERLKKLTKGRVCLYWSSKSVYTDKWNLTVNIEKTKVMVFRKGGTISKSLKWTYNGQEMEIVNNFNYLGIVMSSGGSFVAATNTLYGKALKAIHSLFSLIN